MAQGSSRFTNGLLNVVLMAVGLGAAVLLYAFAGQTVFTGSRPERPPSDTSELVGQIIQVEVRNGAGVDHLAERTTQYLRDRGFDVVDMGNHSSFDQDQSVVIDRIGNLEAARNVAEALGIPPSRVRQNIKPAYYLDASVILGRDYAELRPFRETR
ncbi:LytR C-terminal domain-containing protein [Salinibacter altiplanensis]|uniref:LytR C-terminal domain-containing protein n=1 Tax=Salinibacter altiplanensis TaxID=1803181 RepID=UPI000C9F962B|nr:LytR C-terminal domain-containing protein [Salinibacter altiplanensis]